MVVSDSCIVVNIIFLRRGFGNKNNASRGLNTAQCENEWEVIRVASLSVEQICFSLLGKIVNLRVAIRFTGAISLL